MVSDTLHTASLYGRIIVPECGGPDVLQIVGNRLRVPIPDEGRVNVLAVPVSNPDIEARYGHSPFAPGRIPFVTKSFPFVPGYAIVGADNGLNRDFRHYVSVHNN